MYETHYHRPSSLAEAKRLHAESGDAAYLSGGHTLIPTMKLRLAAPDNLIDLARLSELKGIETFSDRISIGAAMTHAEVAEHSGIQAVCKTLARLAGSIGDAHVRHRGTIGGSIANNDPAADYPSAALAMNATIITDHREMQADYYFRGLYETALEPGEIVTRVVFPVPQAAGYAKFRNPASRYAMAAVFIAKLRDGSVRVAVTGAGNDGVFRWTEAEQRLANDFSANALRELTVDSSQMMGDIHGSSAYRANLVAVMARRALEHLGDAAV